MIVLNEIDRRIIIYYEIELFLPALGLHIDTYV